MFVKMGKRQANCSKIATPLHVYPPNTPPYLELTRPPKNRDELLTSVKETHKGGFKDDMYGGRAKI